MTKTVRTIVFVIDIIIFAQPFTAIAATAAPNRPLAEDPEDCEGYYEGWNARQDYGEAFACFFRNKDWLWVALMQVNGEGTSLDLAAARASLNRLDFKDADASALEAIVKKRAGNPTATNRRVEFCKDVAKTTISSNVCQAREEGEKAQKDNGWLKKVRAGLGLRARPPFDRVRAAFEGFVKAEGDRVYQEYVDGSARNQEAMDQEARARRNFLATIKKIVAAPTSRVAGQRSFPEADRELNAVCSDGVASYAKFSEESAADARGRNEAEMVAEYRNRSSNYKTKYRAAQHAWVRYRDEMGNLAAARWPDAYDAREQARAFVTEDRIRELRGK